MQTKTEFLQIRVSKEFKASISAAAISRSQSVTSFITGAILVAITETKRAKPVPTKAIRGVPAYFRACCAEAQGGGAANYSIAGFTLASALGGEIPDAVQPVEWDEEIEKLTGLLDDRDEAAVWNWFKKHYPNYLALVPNRRRASFLDGVYRARENDRIRI
jgi:hypothetical protein